jgi:tRNA-intron endonuclease
VKATYDDGSVLVEGDARQQLYDAGGFGEPLDGDSVSLSAVEAAYLLREGKISDVDGDGYEAFTRGTVEDTATLRVYADLRDRGYYISHNDDVYMYERGDHPANSSPKTRVETANEDATVEVASLPSILAVADDDGDVTYFSLETIEPDGDFPDVSDTVEVEDGDGRHVVVSGTETLREARYGANEGGDNALVLSSVEAAYLSERGVIDASVATDGRSLRVYADLRDRGVCPRTGFKFGAQFRVYETTGDDHAELLVSPMGRDASVSVTEISRSVRLAHGVRKTTVYALVGEDVEHVAVERERP